MNDNQILKSKETMQIGQNQKEYMNGAYNEVFSKQASAVHLNDDTWMKLESMLPQYHTGRPPKDNRNFMEAVNWIIQTNSPWRNLPTRYGSWKTTYNRYNNWSKKGYLDNILSMLKASSSGIEVVQQNGSDAIIKTNQQRSIAAT